MSQRLTEVDGEKYLYKDESGTYSLRCQRRLMGLAPRRRAEGKSNRLVPRVTGVV